MKLTTKLVLGATVVVGLTTATFAACANDVAMGGKKLTGLADGGMTGEAVHYGQVLEMTSNDLTITDGNFSHHNETYYKIQAQRIGKRVCLKGLLRIRGEIVSGTGRVIGNFDPAYAPIDNWHFFNGVSRATSKGVTFHLTNSGVLTMENLGSGNLPVNDYMGIQTCYTAK